MIKISVIKSKRNTSKMEFIHTARALQLYTIRKCVNFPKRYTFYISQPLVASATNIYACVLKGNGMYPTNQHEVQKRRDVFLDAYAELNNFSAQLELAYEIIEFKPDVLKHWSGLVYKEFSLVKAVLKSDKARFKDLE